MQCTDVSEKPAAVVARVVLYLMTSTLKWREKCRRQRR